MNFQLIYQNNILSNHIAGFFDHHYIWRALINVLGFSHRDIHQERETLKVIFLIRYGQAWPLRPKLAYSCLVCLWLVWRIWPG